MTPAHLRLMRNVLRALARQDVAFHTPVWDELGRVLDREIAETVEEGKLVFQLRLPLVLVAIDKKGRKQTMPLAATMNVFAGMAPWQIGRVREYLDGLILAELPRWPGCRALVPGRRRLVRATRYSTKEPDELSLDHAGCKILLDRAVLAGLLEGDAREHIVRDGRWEKASPKKGSLLFQIFEIV
jgi:hypothetical protein